MKSMNARRLVTIISIVVWVGLFVVLNYMFTIPRARIAYASPDVKVDLHKPLFGVSGSIEDRSNNYAFDVYNSATAIARFDDYLILEKECQYYVSLDRTFIQDIQSNSDDYLSEDELIILLSDICEGTASDDVVLSIEDTDVISSCIVVNVSGKYTGYITLEDRHVKVHKDDTNFDEVWDFSESIPYVSILICIVSSLVITALVTIVIRRCLLSDIS